MKKILSFFCMLIACTNMAFGQVTISTSDLIGTKWQLTDTDDTRSKPFYEFALKSALWHCSDGTTFSYPYYLSASIPTAFDSTKVGKRTKGCYYTKYNSKMDCFYCYAIKSFNKSTGKMVIKRVYPTDVIGLTDTFTFIMMKK